MSEEKETDLRKENLQKVINYIGHADDDDCIAIEDALIKKMTELGFTEDDDKEDAE